MQTSVKGDIWRATRAGRLPAQRKDDGGFEIDPAELSRVFEPQRPDERPMGRAQRPLRRLRRRSTMGLPGMAGGEATYASPTLFARGFHRAVQMRLSIVRA